MAGTAIAPSPPAPTGVSTLITDSVAQANVKVLGDIPAASIGVVYQVLAQSIGMSMQNSTANQLNATSIATSATGVITAALAKMAKELA